MLNFTIKTPTEVVFGRDIEDGIGERIDTAFRSPSEALFSPSGKTERHFSSSPASTVV